MKISFILILLILGGVIGFFLIGDQKTPFQRGNLHQSKSYWVQDEGGWKATGTPPKCPEPLELASFADVRKATSVLYPGQMRSAGYEPTAGYRFDGLPNDAISITIPMDGEIVMAARFLVGGELQYVFDILNPCGIMVRLDHLLTLTPKFQDIANKLPQPKENDNRSTPIAPPVSVSKGEIIATATGLRKGGNTFSSITMFDFRGKNKISQDPGWAREHAVLYHYGVCPYPFLPKSDYERIKTLPAADYLSGAQSDYCDLQ